MKSQSLFLPLIGTMVALTANAAITGAVPILNGSFENSTATTGSGTLFDTTINDWFMENQTASPITEAAQRRNAANMPVVPSGSQWANLVTDASYTAGIYQAIDTYAANWEYTLSGFTVSQRSNQPFSGVTIELYSGNVAGANSATLSGLGATLLDSFTVPQSVFPSTAALSYVVPDFTLVTGTTGVTGQTVWLRFTTTGNGHHLIDNVAVAAIPEPSHFALGLGLLAVGSVFARRRMKR